MNASPPRGLAALALASVLVLAVPLIARAAPGDLDSTFSGDGMQNTDLGDFNEVAKSVVGLSGGKLLVLGRTRDDVGLVQYRNGGLPDTAFGGGDGIVTVNFLGDEQVYNGIVVLPSGRIVVAGDTQGTGRRRLAVYRFTATGAPDSTFGGGDGKLAIDYGHDLYGYDLAVLGSGKMLVSGELNLTNLDSVFFVARLRPNGTRDTTFGGGDGFVTTQFLAGHDGAWHMSVDSQGRIVVGGWAEERSNAFSNDVALARYTPAGKPDRTFGGDGKVITQIYQGENDWAGGVALQGSKIVAGAYTNDGTVRHFGLVRYLSNGSLDPTFGGGDGVVITPGSVSRELEDVAVDPTGRILAAGDESVSPQQFVVARYLANGKLDTAFGTGGFAPSNFASPATANGMALASGGKIVVVGREPNGPSDFAVARFLP